MCSITYGRAQTWDWEGIVHYELLLPAKTIDSNLYCQDYNKPLKKNRPGKASSFTIYNARAF